MTFTKDQKKVLLAALSAGLLLLILYRVATHERPATAPLTYQRGSVAASSVRRGLPSPASPADPLALFLERRKEPFPRVQRDLFRMEDPVVRPKVVSQPVPTLPFVQLPPPLPEKTPEELAADQARTDLSKFRFLGYLTDKDRSLFLSKDGELFIVKSGDAVLKTYAIKSAGKDFVVLLDTVTRVEVRVELSGSGPDQSGSPQRR